MVKTCTECGIQKSFEFFYKKKESADGFHTKCKECVKTRAKAWYANNIDQAKEARKAWREANPEKTSETSRNWREQNPERMRELSRQWHQSNKHRDRASREALRKERPGMEAALSAKRYASKRQATPMWADYKAIERFYEDARLLTEVLGVPFHVDHIVPLRSRLVCGLHCEANLRVILGAENLAKSNTTWPDMP